MRDTICMFDSCYDQVKSSAIYEITNEFSQKLETALLDEACAAVDSIKQENNCLKKENANLKKVLSQTETDLKNANTKVESSSLMAILINNLKSTIEATGDVLVYNFLDLLFKKDFKENIKDVPVWLGAITQYYSNRETVIEILRMLGIYVPDKIENFRLPIDWTEEELDIFFETMYNHINCNNCVYEDNLKYWGSSSLESVKVQCSGNFSEIPWQYVLRNPLLKNTKYLEKIGKNVYNKSNYSKFYLIDTYLKLTPLEIKTILNNIDSTKLKHGKTADFIIRNLKYVESSEMLKKIYSMYSDSYDFKCRGKILEMPYDYILQWAGEQKTYIIKLMEDNKEFFTEKQRKELIMKAFNLEVDN